MAREDPRKEPRRGPVILDLEETPLPDAPSPAEAPPIGDDGDAPSGEQALRRAARPPALGGLFWPALAGLVLLALSVATVDFVLDLFSRTALLGWLGAALLALVLVGLAAGILREAAALARLSRVETLQRMARSAAETPGPAPARAVLDGLAKLYAPRPELAAAAGEAASRAAEIPDGPEIVRLAERRLMPGLDAAAERAVTRAAQRVAAATAFLPMPALDIVIVLFTNAAMIRRIAEVYGGRAGWLGSWRLLRAVAQHLAATGAIAATDDLLGPMVGGGVLGRISRRFGEAAVNAALTARVGTAAIEVCRPLPFAVRPAPRARALVLAALRGWRPEER
jgi:putative membrane protein